MTIKPIKSDQDYEMALQEMERLWEVQSDTPEADQLDILVTLVEAYERERYVLPPPDPIAAIEYFMESQSWTEKELAPLLGGRLRVREVLARSRPLTLTMIRNLERETGIPATILIQPYPTTPIKSIKNSTYAVSQTG